MKHKYYISAVIEEGFVGLCYSLDFTLDTINGINKLVEIMKKDGYEKMVILFFKELKE